MKRFALLFGILMSLSFLNCFYYGFVGRIEPGYKPTYYVMPNGYGVGVYEYDPEEMMIAVGNDGKIRRLAAERENVGWKRTFYVIPANVFDKVPNKVEVWDGDHKIKVRKEKGRWAFDWMGKKDRSIRKLTVKVYYKDYLLVRPGAPELYVDSKTFRVYNCYGKGDPECYYEWGP